jgi:serine/threonine-protein kinase ATR
MKQQGVWPSQDFNAGVARSLIALRDGNIDLFGSEISELRSLISRSFSPATTISLSSAHSHMLRLHVLYEMEILSGFSHQGLRVENILHRLDRRLNIIGSFTEDKQYILGIRRAVLEQSK